MLAMLVVMLLVMGLALLIASCDSHAGWLPIETRHDPPTRLRQ